ncbi:MAG TPA: two-component regulator propeller domain-containing protein [Azospirillaceae bacterium]|nr:two-component regulator propeller domain-containing protein [Azospirillaceae bacterium]
MLALAVALSWPAGLRADPWQGASVPLFENIRRDQDRPIGYVTAVAQDTDGFLWIGTAAGLLRYDGYRFKAFGADPGAAGDLPDSYIRALHVDGRGRLWIGTSAGGLAWYDPRQERFVRSDAALNHVDVWSIEEDGEGGLWIGTYGGLARMDAAGAVTQVPTAQGRPDGLPQEQVRVVRRDRRGGVWVGTAGGLAHRPAGSDRFQRIVLPGEAPDAGDAVGAIAEDGRGRIWVGTEHLGVVVLEDAGDGPRASVPPDMPAGLRQGWVRAIVETRPGVMWIGTVGDGIWQLDTAQGAWMPIRHDLLVPNSLSSNNVLSFFRDRSGLVWVGTYLGLGRFDPSADAIRTLFVAAKTPDGSLDRSVRAMAVAADGGLWVGHGELGIDILDRDGRPVGSLRADPGHPDQALPRRPVRALALLPDGTAWIGTRQGLFRSDPPAPGQPRQVRRVVLPTRDAVPDIYSMHLRRNTLWIGTYNNGLIGYDTEAGTVRTVEAGPQGLTDSRINSILPKGPDELWIGTRNGLNILNTVTGAVERIEPRADAPDGLPGGDVVSLLTDLRGRLWVAAYGRGVAVMEGRDAEGRPRFRTLSGRDGLPANAVGALALDHAGNVWASTDAGIARIDPETLAVRPLQKADGVALSSYWAGSVATGPDGEILFGAEEGITLVRPERLADWTYSPPLVVTDAHVGRRPIPSDEVQHQTGPLWVRPDDHGFRLEVAALDYSAPERNRYAYLLEGLESTWTEVDGSRRQIAYTGLPPGSYRLRVRGSNRAGQWAQSELVISVVVFPAWYQTLWFRGMLIAGGLAAIAGLIQARTTYLRFRERTLEREVAARTLELAQQKEGLANALSELRETKDQLVQREKLASLGQLVAGIAHEVNTPVGVLLSAATHLEAEADRVQSQVGSGKLTRTEFTNYLAFTRDAGRLIARNAERAASLISSFKQVAADRTSEELRSISVRRYVEDVVELVGPLLRDNAVACRIDGPDDVLLTTYPGLLAQVVTNLVQNAVLHAFAGTAVKEIQIQVAAVEDRVTIVVSDNGVGIEPSVLPRIFEPFFTTRRGSGGTGLGLHMVHNIVHGPLCGRISVFAQHGLGSRFVMEFPARHPGPSVAPARSDVHLAN